jgi:hypothetical protein
MEQAHIRPVPSFFAAGRVRADDEMRFPLEGLAGR